MIILKDKKKGLLTKYVKKLLCIRNEIDRGWQKGLI